MRIKLEKGRQKELILKAKNTETWKQLSNKIGLNEKYLFYELKNEMRLLPKEVYNKLCIIAKEDYDKYQEEELDDNWGRSKGGLISPGSKIKINKPLYSEELSEFVGAVLGDGHVCYIKKGKKIGVYVIRIAGDLVKDRDYHLYLKKIGQELFNLKSKEIFNKHHNERFLDFYSKELVEFFIDMGIKPGNKIKNQSTIPKWIFTKKSFMGTCLRGLIDTDGSIYRMSNKDPNLLRINFTNYNLTLLKDARNGFIKLGFNPSKIIRNKAFNLSRQKEIRKYIKEIGFKNSKHLKRFEEFSPVVQRSSIRGSGPRDPGSNPGGAIRIKP